jgi:hypothetical protein
MTIKNEVVPKSACCKLPSKVYDVEQVPIYRMMRMAWVGQVLHVAEEELDLEEEVVVEELIIRTLRIDPLIDEDVSP